MKRQILLLLAFLFSLSVDAARSEIISGRVDLLSCGIDFSTQRCTTVADSTDLIAWYDGACGWFLDGCFVPSNFAATAGTLGEICAPPASGYWFCSSCTWDVFASEFEPFSYVLHTGDGYWVKFALPQGCLAPEPGCSEILYFVQMDGTSNLCPVPVEPTTWGEIKQLYE